MYDLMKMPSIRVLFVTAAMAISLSAAQQDAVSRARAMAKDAYETIFQHPFEPRIIEAAAKNLDQAHALNEKEPYIWLGVAELVLAGGFHSGRLLDARNYEPGTVDRASALAQKAIEVDNKIADAHVVAAKLSLMRGRFTDAQRELDLAHSLEPNAFMPVYYQAVWYWRQGSAAKCQEALRTARTLAHGEWDQRLILSQLEQMAEARGDDEQEEKILKALIALDPNRSWSHGNYGWFLLERERYDEAIAQFEKAVALGSYSLAEEGLQRARRQRDAAHGRH